MSGRSLFVWFESRPGRAKTLKIGTSVWPRARHNDCSREILQCGCNLRRSPVVLPTAFHRNNLVEEDQVHALEKSLQHPKQISAQAIVDATGRTILVLCIVCTRNCAV